MIDFGLANCTKIKKAKEEAKIPDGDFHPLEKNKSPLSRYLESQ